MSAVAEPTMTAAERGALKQDCVEKIAKLGPQERALEGHAPSPLMKEELAAMRSERESAEATLRALLEDELSARQTADQAERQAAEGRAAHLQRAAVLGAERQRLAQAIDASLKAFAGLLGHYHEVARQQADELMSGGNRAAADVARPKARYINAALRHALIAANVPSAVIELPHLSGGRIESLIEGDAVAIEPAS